MNVHETVILEIDGQKCQIDKKLAPLIEELNKVGLKTKYCCEGDGDDLAYIAFDPSEIILYVTSAYISLRWKINNNDTN